MAFAVTNDFTAGTNAVAADVNQNFTDIENELNAFPTDGTINAGAIGATQLATGAVTTTKITDANITLVKMAANSIDSDQYVDGSIDPEHIANLDPDSYSFDNNPAEQSTTFPNGLIMKSGYIAYAATNAITFGTAFPTKVLSVFVSGVNSSAVTCNAVTTSLSTTGFTIYDSDSKTGHYWMAWGY